MSCLDLGLLQVFRTETQRQSYEKKCKWATLCKGQKECGVPQRPRWVQQRRWGFALRSLTSVCRRERKSQSTGQEALGQEGAWRHKNIRRDYNSNKNKNVIHQYCLLTWLLHTEPPVSPCVSANNAFLSWEFLCPGRVLLCRIHPFA